MPQMLCTSRRLGVLPGRLAARDAACGRGGIERGAVARAADEAPARSREEKRRGGRLARAASEEVPLEPQGATTRRSRAQLQPVRRSEEPSSRTSIVIQYGQHCRFQPTSRRLQLRAEADSFAQGTVAAKEKVG